MAATPEPPGGAEAGKRPLRLIVVSGMSGSGKSVALNVLEDSGYYCVDNLPANLLDPLVAFVLQAGYDKIAAGVDVRSGPTLERLPGSLEELRSRVSDVRLLFLDAKTDTLVKRFSETRRRHPLSDSTSTLQECIQAERLLLAELGTLGHRIDTSDLSPNALRSWVKDFVGMSGGGMTLLFQSFGFKHGIPLDADLVFDVRCLPNPHYDPVLQPLTGKDAAVIDFLQADENARRMLADIGAFVEQWLPCYLRDNRSYLTVAVGCTGGRHRSVYFTEQLAQRFRPQLPALVRHRELAE